MKKKDTIECTPIIPNLSDEMIRAYAQSEKIYMRGSSYYKEGAVRECLISNNMVRAYVSGSQMQPYTVSISFDANGITRSRCTCDYDGCACKHIIATLLECLNNPQNVFTAKSIIDSLAALNEVQLRRLIEILLDQNPALHYQLKIEIDELIQKEIAKKQLTSNTSASFAINPELYSQAVYSAFKKAQSGYFQAFAWDGDEIINQHLRFIDKIEQFVLQNDSPKALIILEAITPEYVNACDNFINIYDEDGEISAAIGDIFYLLVTTWCKTIGSSSLSDNQEKRITNLIKDWQNQLNRCKCDFIHEISIDLTPVLLTLAKLKTSRYG